MLSLSISHPHFVFSIQYLLTLLSQLTHTLKTHPVIKMDRCGCCHQETSADSTVNSHCGMQQTGTTYHWFVLTTLPSVAALSPSRYRKPTARQGQPGNLVSFNRKKQQAVHSVTLMMQNEVLHRQTHSKGTAYFWTHLLKSPVRPPTRSQCCCNSLLAFAGVMAFLRAARAALYRSHSCPKSTTCPGAQLSTHRSEKKRSTTCCITGASLCRIWGT